MFKIILASATLMMIFLQNAYALHDPMQPPAIYDAPIKTDLDNTDVGFNLTSIIVSNKKISARINGKTVVTGDMINGAKIIDITRNSVSLNLEGKTLLLQIIKSIKKSSNIPLNRHGDRDLS